MNPVLQNLTRHGALDRQALEAFVEENEFPLVDGRSCTFLYRGPGEEVHLRHWIYGLSSSLPFQHLPGTDMWVLTMDLPERSRVEYKLEVHYHGRAQLLRDEHNPNTAHDPYGANSVVYGAGYEFPEWALESADSRPGTIEDVAVPGPGGAGSREVQVYLPARFRQTRRYPLLIAHDGPDYVQFSNLKEVLDNLTHRLEIPPMVVALTRSEARLREYAGSREHSDWLAEQLVPAMEERYPLVDTPDARELLGASFGAVASLAAAWHHPGVFGRLLLQSGSFAFTDIGDHDRGPAFDPIVEFMNEFREAPGKPSEKLYMSCGTYESLITYNRSMVPLLQETGMDVRFDEARDGHNWENWRDRLRAGLSWLFPGPLWMVYE